MTKSKSQSGLAHRPRLPSSIPQPVVATPLPTTSAPLSSRPPSVYPIEGEEWSNKDEEPFRFLELPSELRNKIYGFVFTTAPAVIDLDPDNWKKIHRSLAIFRVSKQVHNESSHQFFSTHTIRLFPTHPGRFFRTTKPLLARLQPRHRASIQSLELRLGPGFTNPPRGWVVNDALGLQDAVSAKILKVMVEVDTSDPLFKGFRRGDDGFYEEFSKNLLRRVLASTPSIVEIQFDAYPSVQQGGNMMKELLSVAQVHNKLISWGPERGWKDKRHDEWENPAPFCADVCAAAGDAVLDLAAFNAALPEVAIAA